MAKPKKPKIDEVVDVTLLEIRAGAPLDLPVAEGGPRKASLTYSVRERWASGRTAVRDRMIADEHVSTVLGSLGKQEPFVALLQELTKLGYEDLEVDEPPTR